MIRGCGKIGIKSTSPIGVGLKRRDLLLSGSSLVAASALSAVGLTIPAEAQQPTATPAPTGQKPNIVVIMADDVGWSNIGAYHRGILAGRTPNLDRLAAEGMLFTDYYAEASCTAGRSNFVTGQLPIRTGLTTVGQAGAKVGMLAETPTIATALKAMGYATGQFGKNHLGDRNEYLPTLHGFDEFFGYLYHLDAMEDPFHPNYPKDLLDKVGPRDLVHCLATDKDDPTEHPRWGRVGKQTDRGRRPARTRSGWKPVDDEIIVTAPPNSWERRQAGKPFFCWMNPSRMHIVTHLRREVPEHAQSRERLDRVRGWNGAARRRRRRDHEEAEDLGVADNTIVVFTTDNGAENFTWPDGGQTPFAGGKGTVLDGGFRVPCIVRWPGHVPTGKVENGLMSGLDWFPTLLAAAGNPDIAAELRAGKKLGERSYRCHLDGYNQLDFISGKGRRQAPRALLLRRSDARRGAHRRLQVPLHRPAAGLARRHRQGRTSRSSRTYASIRTSVPDFLRMGPRAGP